MTRKKMLFGLILCGLSMTKTYSQNNLNDEIMNAKTVTVVKSKAPWYAFDFLLAKKFKEANPVYQKISGLEFKAYTINRDTPKKNFGGIYLWNDKQNAQNWYTQKWFEDIKKKRGIEPTLEYYEVVSSLSYLPTNTDYSAINTKSVAVFIHYLTKSQAAELSAKQDGLFRVYFLTEQDGKNALMLFFESAQRAASFLKSKKINNYEWFKIPVMLNNVK